MRMVIEFLERRQYLSTTAPGRNLLFLGNSFTGYNNVPGLVSDVAVADGQTTPHIYSQLLYGLALSDHLAKIASDGTNNVIDHSLPAGASWNDVILQELSTKPTNVTAAPVNGDPTGFRRDALALFQHVKQNSPSAQAVLEETWARGPLNPFYPGSFANPSVMQAQLLSNYTLAQGDINSAYGAQAASLAEVGEAWRALGWAGNLYDGADEYHPSPRGSMLAALILYSTIYQNDTSDIPATSVTTDLTQLGLTSTDWQQLTQLSDAITHTAPLPSGGSLTGQQVTAGSAYNLTTIGTSDWAHWGRGGNLNTFDHKATGGSQISNVTVVGTGAVSGGYADASRATTWTDGSPATSDANEHGYIWSNGALNTGFSFTVPADTTMRTLTVYAGGYGTSNSLTAHLSGSSAADYVATASGAGHYSQFYTITYSAASAGQTLKLTLLKTGNITGTNGSVDLIAAALSGSPAPIPGAGSLTGSQASAASAYNVTSLGTRDWAHYAHGTAPFFDHKAAGGSQISSAIAVGSGAQAGVWQDSSRSVTWTDGSPTASDASDHGYIWENGALNTGYTFTVPADTTSRTLYVYAGGYGTAGSFTAHLSDGSAADYVATSSGSGIYTKFYTITYNAASAGQTLTITLLKTANITGTNGSVDLIAAALT